jgi:hypothetical protein
MSSFGPGRGRPPARQSLTSGPPVDLMHKIDLRAPPPDKEDDKTDQPWGHELRDPAPNSFRTGFSIMVDSLHYRAGLQRFKPGTVQVKTAN